MKKIISIAVAMFMAVSCMGLAIFNVSAAGSSVIQFSSKEITVGDQFTVTVNINADENMMATQFALQYDPQVLEFISGDSSSGGAGVISVVHPVGNSKSARLSYTFKAIKAGSCYVSTSDSVYVNFDEAEISVPNQGASVAVKDVSLSNNAKLKSLKVSEGTLTPAFSSSTTSYSVTVEKGVTDCKIYAVSDDGDAKVQVNGGNDLKVGKNNCTVTVTAANGTQKTYNIVITRQEETKSENESTSSDESSSEESSEEESSEEESSDEETSSEEGSLDIKVDGHTYTVANDISSVDIPLGFSAKKATYNGNDVTVITDENENYVIYYLGNSKGKELHPYVLNQDTYTFEKVQHLKQSGRYYIFCDLPDNSGISEGYYTTSTNISDFNVECYSSNEPEFSSFYYMYCYNGEDYGYYRYDSLEKVLQRYPEMTVKMQEVSNSTEVDESFAAKFASLSNNAKIIVIGFFLAVIGIITLVILLLLRIFRYRNGAKFASDIGYADEFDDVNFVNKFSMDNDGFLTDDDDEITANLDFGDDFNDEKNETADYLIKGEPEEGNVIPDEEDNK